MYASTAIAWVVSLMTLLSPPKDTTRASWLPEGSRETKEEAEMRYAQIAEALVSVATSPEEAADLLATSFAESGWAKDVDLGYRRGEGVDTCLMQIRVLKGAKTAEGFTADDLVQDRRKCFQVGLRILRASRFACAALPVEERQAAYLAGKCDSTIGKRKSRERFALARSLLRKKGDVPTLWSTVTFASGHAAR